MFIQNEKENKKILKDNVKTAFKEHKELLIDKTTTNQVMGWYQNKENDFFDNNNKECNTTETYKKNDSFLESSNPFIYDYNEESNLFGTLFLETDANKDFKEETKEDVYLSHTTHLQTVRDDFVICSQKSNPFIFDNINLSTLAHTYSMHYEEEIQEQNSNDKIEIKSQKTRGNSPGKNKNSLKKSDDPVEELRQVVEKLTLKIEKERKEVEDESNSKFKKLLDKLSHYLNTNLITSIESCVKKEVKNGILILKKQLSESLFEMENKTIKILKETKGKETETVVTGFNGEEINKLVKELFLTNVIPRMELAVDEMKKQILQEAFSIKEKNENIIKEETIPAVDFKDEIMEKIQRNEIAQASLLALDCDDDIFRVYIDVACDKSLESIDSNLQFMLMKRALVIFDTKKDFENNRTIYFLKNCLMTIDIAELEEVNLFGLSEILDYLVEHSWDTELDSIIKFQNFMLKKSVKKRNLIQK